MSCQLQHGICLINLYINLVLFLGVSIYAGSISIYEWHRKFIRYSLATVFNSIHVLVAIHVVVYVSVIGNLLCSVTFVPIALQLTLASLLAHIYINI